MKALFVSLATAYGICVATWIFYLAVMNLAPHRGQLHPVAKAHAYALLGVGLALDLVLNFVVGTILFLKHPQDWLLTGRLTRYIKDEQEARWRRATALWLCRHLLDQFDPKGGHCR